MANNFKIEGLPGLQEKLKSHPVQVSKAIEFAIKDTLNKIIDEQVQQAPVDRGPLRANITMQHMGKLQYKVICQVPYAAYIEFGTGRRFTPIPEVDASPYRGGGGKKSGVGFYDSILAWVKRKGIGAQKTKSGRVSKSKGSQQAMIDAAMAIYKSILRNGSRPHPFFFGPLLKRRKELTQRIEKAVKGKYD